MTFKDGYVIKQSNEAYIWLSIIKNVKFCADEGTYHTDDYVSLLINDGDSIPSFDTQSSAAEKIEKATEEEKQKLIDPLRESEKPKAKEYLKRFLGIEEKKKYEFKPKDWVLCRIGDEWCLCRFSHKTMRFDGVLMFVTVGGVAYEQCIPYNEQTAHLIGKADDWKE